MNFWNKKIISFEDRYFGLDLSDLSVKVFELEKDGEKHKINSFGHCDMPQGCIEDGVIVDKEKVVAAIRKAIESAGPRKIRTKKVICSLPESKAFLRVLSIPKIKEEDAEEAIKWEIEASIPLSVDQVYFDWQFISHKISDKDKIEKNNKQDVLIVAVSREAVDSLVELLEAASLEVYGLELESVATVRSLIPENKSEGGVFLVVDLGAERTSFIITENNIPYFTSSIPFSSEALTDNISKCLGVDSSEAEKVKIDRGIIDFEKDRTILTCIEPLLTNLTVEIEKSIDFYSQTYKGSEEIRKIILCGGGSNLKGLIPYLSKKLKTDIEVGDPWINLNLGTDLPPIKKDNAAGYATAVGLAMRSYIWK